MTSQYLFGNADEALKRKVWNKGRIIPGYDPNVWRHDVYGGVMRYSDHGDTSSKFGWEIDHINPIAKGGTNGLENLQPLYWENNRRKGAA